MKTAVYKKAVDNTVKIVNWLKAEYPAHMDADIISYRLDVTEEGEVYFYLYDSDHNVFIQVGGGGPVFNVQYIKDLIHVFMDNIK